MTQFQESYSVVAMSYYVIEYDQHWLMFLSVTGLDYSFNVIRTIFGSLDLGMGREDGVPGSLLPQDILLCVLYVLSYWLALFYITRTSVSCFHIRSQWTIFNGIEIIIYFRNKYCYNLLYDPRNKHAY